MLTIIIDENHSYLFEYTLFNQNTTESHHKDVFIFPPAIVHLQEEHGWQFPFLNSRDLTNKVINCKLEYSLHVDSTGNGSSNPHF